MRGFKEIKILGQQNPTGVPKHCTDTMVNRCMTVYYSNLCYHRHRSFVRSIAAFTTLCIILRMNIYLCSFSECSYFCMHFTLELCPLLLQLCSCTYLGEITGYFTMKLQLQPCLISLSLLNRNCKYRRGIQMLSCVLSPEGGGSVTSQLQKDLE